MRKLYRIPNELVESFIDYNKLIKANILMCDSRMKRIVGFGYDSDELGVVKEMYNYPFDYPSLPFDIVFMTKDLSSLYKESKSTGVPICAETECYHWNRNCAINLFCGDMIKSCFNFRIFLSKYNWFCSFKQNGILSYSFQDIKNNNTDLFSPIFNSKASDGIISLNIDGKLGNAGEKGCTVFVPPTFIGSLKSDSVGLNIFDADDVRIVEFLVKKKHGIQISVEYAMINVNKQY